MFLLGMSISLICINSCIRTVQLDIDPKLEFGWTHFLMMGMNARPRNGTYAPEDMDFSEDCVDKADRYEKNLQETKKD